MKTPFFIAFVAEDQLLPLCQRAAVLFQFFCFHELSEREANFERTQVACIVFKKREVIADTE